MHMAEGNVDAAVRDFRSVVDLSPEAAPPRIQLARMLLESGSIDEARDVLTDSRIEASSEEADEIKQLQQAISQVGGAPSSTKEDKQQAFEAFARTRSSREMREAILRHPLLTTPKFIDELDRYVRENLTGESAKGFEERLRNLRQIVLNPAQMAFDAVVSANSDVDLRAALAKHPLLQDQEFLDYLIKMASQLEPESLRVKLNSSVAILRSLNKRYG
jgi:uncharacterized membrane protein YccC